MLADAFTSVLDTNLVSAYRLTKRAVPKMIRARKGRIVLISSVVALTGSGGQANYAASKAGVVEATEVNIVQHFLSLVCVGNMYERFGFIKLHRTERWMERPDPNMKESPDYWAKDKIV